ncbi:unnamed protein product [Amoebophrya sp. A25]|nr:unnamed protein product [Amoebophrya sp. A25]|eukprot:GSA25T00018637001.1
MKASSSSSAGRSQPVKLSLLAEQARSLQSVERERARGEQQLAFLRKELAQRIREATLFSNQRRARVRACTDAERRVSLLRTAVGKKRVATRDLRTELELKRKEVLGRRSMVAELREESKKLPKALDDDVKTFRGVMYLPPHCAEDDGPGVAVNGPPTDTSSSRAEELRRNAQRLWDFLEGKNEASPTSSSSTKLPTKTAVEQIVSSAPSTATSSTSRIGAAAARTNRSRDIFSSKDDFDKEHFGSPRDMESEDAVPVSAQIPAVRITAQPDERNNYLRSCTGFGFSQHQLSDRFFEVRACLRARQAWMLRDLMSIFPIETYNTSSPRAAASTKSSTGTTTGGGGTKANVRTIRELPLEAIPALLCQDARDRDARNTALGFLGHFVLLLSKYLDVPLRNSLRWTGTSRCFLQRKSGEVTRRSTSMTSWMSAANYLMRGTGVLQEREQSSRQYPLFLQRPEALQSFGQGLQLLMANLAQLYYALGHTGLYSSSGLLENIEWLTSKEQF